MEKDTLGLKSASKIAAIFIGFFVLAPPAQAQFEPLQFAVCKKITVDVDRLKCFDLIGPKPKTAEEEAKDPTLVKGKWVYTDSKSPVDDSDQVLAVLAGEPGDAMLVFRCMEKRTEVALVPPQGFFATGRATVLIRIGSEEPETISMNVGTNNRALFASPAQDFMRLMPDNTKLFFRATGYQGKQADATFNLADVSVARDRVADTCHWSTLKTDRSLVPPMPSSAPKPKTAKPVGADVKLN
jgi:hypothetical protein